MAHTTLTSPTLSAPVLEGTVSLPRVGVWHADLTLDAPEAPTGRVTLALGKGTSLEGTIERAGVFSGQVRVRVVGGAGGLSKDLSAQWYVGAPLVVPLRDVVEQAGEVMSSAISEDLLSTVITPVWGRMAVPAATALASLSEAVGVVWRVLPDGTIWLGAETWPETPAMPDLVTIEDHGAEGRLIVVSEAPTVLPGYTLNERKISCVIHTIEPSAIRTEIWLEPAKVGVSDRAKAALEAIVRSIVGRRLDYLARYDATVIKQDSAGRLELKLDDARLPSLTRVPIRLGLPGVVVKVKPGARVLVAFERGDPRRPIADLWDGAGLDEIEITAQTKVTVMAPSVVLDKASKLPVARQGDMVAIGGPSMIPVQCSLTIGAVPVRVVTPAGLGTIAPGTPISGLLSILQPAYGLVTSGNPKVGT